MNRSAFRRALPLLVLALAACGSAEPYDALALDVPFVDQYNPQGKGPYYDGSANCGPAVLTGIAKARGQTEGLSDAEAIEILAAVAGTTPEGTSGNGMIAGLEYMGMETDAIQGSDLYWIDDELAAGHVVVAFGDYYAVPGREEPGEHSGHFIAIGGARGGWTMYDVMDPAGSTVDELTDWELETFIVSHPSGGFTISAW